MTEEHQPERSIELATFMEFSPSAKERQSVTQDALRAINQLLQEVSPNRLATLTGVRVYFEDSVRIEAYGDAEQCPRIQVTAERRKT